MKLFIDTDTASDDAVALMMAMDAMKSESVEILGITTVAGNVPLDLATQNALYTRELCQVDVPIVPGASGPLGRPLQTAQFVHGEDGMGDIGLPLSGRRPDGSDGVEFLVDTLRSSSGPVTLVTLGPLTNIALALSHEPRLAESVERCVIMGGTSDSVGNVTPVAEFNIWVDPEAAETVLASELPIEMVGWDISRLYAVIPPDEEEKLRRLGTERARVAVDCQRVLKEFTATQTKLAGFDLPDPIAMAIALNESVCRDYVSARLHVNLSDGLWRGHTLLDSRFTDDRPKHNICTKADRSQFLAMLHASLAPGD